MVVACECGRLVVQYFMGCLSCDYLSVLLLLLYTTISLHPILCILHMTATYPQCCTCRWQPRQRKQGVRDGLESLPCTTKRK